MKRTICLLMILTVLLGASMVASAVTFEGDASYLVGVSSKKGSGFAVHAKAEVISQVFVDGSFLTSSAAKEEGAESSLRHQLLTAGALYRPVIDPDLHVFVGAGYARLTSREPGASEAVVGQGIYGKFGLKMLPMPKLTLVADVAFTPKYKVGNDTGTMTTARATLAYEVLDNLEVQATIKHYRATTPDTANNTLIGGGVSFSF